MPGPTCVPHCSVCSTVLFEMPTALNYMLTKFAVCCITAAPHYAGTCCQC
jgi:hypothetical protein